HPRQALNLNYERNPLDPRTQHELTLKVDDYGNVTQAVAAAYPRRSGGEPEQQRLWITHTTRTFANKPNEATWYRVGVPLETTTGELAGLKAPTAGVFTADNLKTKIAGASPLDYEVAPTPGKIELRTVERSRSLYYDDALAPLAFGEIDSRALPYESR